jgi:hypothetical protein
MCLSLTNITSINSWDCKKTYNLEKDEWRTRRKVNALCTLRHSTIKSSYVSFTIITSQSSCNSEVKSPHDDQALILLSRIFSKLLSWMMSHFHCLFPLNMLCNEIIFNLLLCLLNSLISLFNWKGQCHGLFSKKWISQASLLLALFLFTLLSFLIKPFYCNVRNITIILD